MNDIDRKINYWIKQSIAEVLKDTLDQSGLKPRNIGNTYLSDIVQKNGKIALSHSYWMVLSSNPSKGRNYFFAQVGDGGQSITCAAEDNEEDSDNY